MRRQPILRICAILLFMGCGLLPVAAIEKPACTTMSPDEVDRILNGVFDRAGKIIRLQAELVTTKQGGRLFKKKTIAHEVLKLEAPDLVYLISRGESKRELPLEKCSLIIMDGTYLWELDAREEGEETRLASRRKWESGNRKGAGSGLAGVLSYVVLGGEDVRSARELRERFTVTGFREPLPGREKKETFHFILKRKDVEQTIELWIEPGRTLPWKVKTIEKRKLVGLGGSRGKPRYKLHVEERILSNVKTNLTGLPPFPAGTFIFPLAPDIEVEDAKGDNDNLDHEVLRKELAIIKAKIQTRRKAREAGPQAQPAAPVKGDRK